MTPRVSWTTSEGGPGTGVSPERLHPSTSAYGLDPGSGRRRLDSRTCSREGSSSAAGMIELEDGDGLRATVIDVICHAAAKDALLSPHESG